MNAALRGNSAVAQTLRSSGQKCLSAQGRAPMEILRASCQRNPAFIALFVIVIREKTHVLN